MYMPVFRIAIPEVGADAKSSVDSRSGLLFSKQRTRSDAESVRVESPSVLSADAGRHPQSGRPAEHPLHVRNCLALVGVHTWSLRGTLPATASAHPVTAAGVALSLSVRERFAVCLALCQRHRWGLVEALSVSERLAISECVGH